MEQITKYLIIIASLMTGKLTVTKSNNDTISDMEFLSYSPLLINVCNIVDRRSQVHCYCDTNKPNIATKADCWVFGGGITEEDIIWPSFSSQPKIKHLIFNVRADNALTFIPQKAIIRLEKLRYLSIQFGTIKKIPSYAFTNSSTIREIVLKSNKISILDKHAISQMMMLSNLSLEENQISELKRDVFIGLPNLQTLNLASNNLSLIHEGCFKHLNNLIELQLDINYISVITRETFEGLENLFRLSLRHNKLSMIGNLAFSELWGLKELLLDNNAIEYISERAFGGLAQLKKLTLSSNKLTTFYEDVLEEIRNLIVLDLRYNLLESISEGTVRLVVKNEKAASAAVYLEGNPFNCNCRLSWVYMLRNETRDNSLRSALEKISCINDQAERQLNDQEDKENVNDNAVVEYSYDYYDKDDNDSEKKLMRKTTKLLDIPLEFLPCPKELTQTEEFGYPVQNEIKLKAFSNVERISPCLLVIVLGMLLC